MKASRRRMVSAASVTSATKGVAQANTRLKPMLALPSRPIHAHRRATSVGAGG
jgi:hypothetical protein